MEGYNLITNDCHVIVAGYQERCDTHFHRGAVECSVGGCLLDFEATMTETFKQYPQSKKANITRVLVSKPARNQGVATRLMKMVCDHADKNGIILDLGINPYGDLNFEQLLAFYKKFGFVEYEKTGVCYRLPKGIIIAGL